MTEVALVGIVYNEHDHIHSWCHFIAANRDYFAGVYVVDGNSVDDTLAVLQGCPAITRVFSRAFTDYADQRNYVLSEVETEYAWVMELDCDEVISRPLLTEIQHLVEIADSNLIDAYGIPRLNFIDGLLQQGVGSRGLDYQYRLHRSSVKWVGSVHETLTGFRNRQELAIEDGHYIVHQKSLKRHTERNATYLNIQNQHKGDLR